MEKKQTKVRRIKAEDNSKKVSKTKADSGKKIVKNSSKTTPKWLATIKKPFIAMGQYFKGSWHELKLTKWPNRRTTWTMTLAVLIFCVFFAALILLVDFGFEELMKLILERGA